MLKKEKEYKLSLPFLAKNIGSLLIKSGDNDDALIYQAPVEYLRKSMIVFFHKESRLLERIKLFGAIKVSVELHERAKFMAELNLTKSHHESNGNIAVILNVHEEIPFLKKEEKYMIPMT
jgi:hypothetical protein